MILATVVRAKAVLATVVVSRVVLATVVGARVVLGTESLTVNLMKENLIKGGNKYQIGGISGHRVEEHLIVVKSIQLAPDLQPVRSELHSIRAGVFLPLLQYSNTPIIQY